MPNEVGFQIEGLKKLQLQMAKFGDYWGHQQGKFSKV